MIFGFFDLSPGLGFRVLWLSFCGLPIGLLWLGTTLGQGLRGSKLP
jgi:hypothetical protein